MFHKDVLPWTYVIMLSRIRGTLSTILPLDSSDDQFSLDFDSLKLSTGSSSFPDIPNTSIDLTLNGASDFNPLENIDFSDDLNSFSLWPASAEGFNEIGNDDTLIIDELSQSQVPNIFNEPVEGDQFVPWNPDQFPPSSLIGDGIYASDYKPSGSCDHWKAGGYQEFLCCGGPVDFETDRVTMVESGDVKQAMATWIDNCVRLTEEQDRCGQTYVSCCQTFDDGHNPLIGAVGRGYSCLPSVKEV